MFESSTEDLVASFTRAVYYLLGLCLGFGANLSGAILSGDTQTILTQISKVLLIYVLYKVFHSTINSLLRMVLFLIKITFMLTVISALFYTYTVGPEKLAQQASALYIQIQPTLMTAQSTVKLLALHKYFPSSG